MSQSVQELVEFFEQLKATTVVPVTGSADDPSKNVKENEEPIDNEEKTVEPPFSDSHLKRLVETDPRVFFNVDGEAFKILLERMTKTTQEKVSVYQISSSKIKLTG